VARALDRLAVELLDDVADLDARAFGRAAAFDAAHQRAGRLGQAERARHVARDLGDAHAVPPANHPPAGAQLVGDAPRLVDRDGERDAHESASAAIDLRVDAGHLAGD